jgi:hypothetical protein
MVAILTVGVDLVLLRVLYQHWSTLPLLIRGAVSLALISSIPAVFFQFFGEEITEIGAQKLSIRKGVHGWERNPGI